MNEVRPKLKVRVKSTKPVSQEQNAINKTSKAKYEVQYAKEGCTDFKKLKAVKSLEEARSLVQSKTKQGNETKHAKSLSFLSLFTYQIVDLSTGEVVR